MVTRLHCVIRPVHLIGVLHAMFGKSNKARGSGTAKPPKGADPLGNSPQTAYEKARQEYFERTGSPVVERARYFVLAALFAGAFIALVVALIRLMPLNRVEPYVVQVDKITGETAATRAAARAYKPGDREKQYFIVRYVRGLLQIDRNTVAQSLAEVYRNSRGKALDEFTDFVKTTKPIVRAKTEIDLVRNVEIKSFSLLNEQSAIVRVETVERGLNKATLRKAFVVTLHFAIDPPKTETEIMENPIGLFVTHFAINEDMT